jgi:hypothetical protein
MAAQHYHRIDCTDANRKEVAGGSSSYRQRRQGQGGAVEYCRHHPASRRAPSLERPGEAVLCPAVKAEELVYASVLTMAFSATTATR